MVSAELWEEAIATSTNMDAKTTSNVNGERRRASKYSGTTRRTRASDPDGSTPAASVNGKVASVANNTTKDTSNTTTSTAPATSTLAHQNTDQGDNHRTCVRCRVKKTKCDRLQPSCSNCMKGGVEETCMYDNEESTTVMQDPGDGNTSLLSSTSTRASTKEDTTSGQSASAKIELEGPGSQKGRKTGASARATTTTPTNGHVTRSSTSRNGNNRGNSSKNSDHSTPNESKAELASATVEMSSQSSHEPLKAEASAPGLSIASSDPMEDVTVDQETLGGSPGISTTSAKQTPSSVGPSNRQKKQTKGGPANQARVSADSPAPKLVIDKSQRARKWDRPSIVIRTLGGEVSVPVWVSDQEMLLNEPRPHNPQRSYPTPTTPSNSGPASATATTLARLAVLNQLDTNHGYDSPERGTTPESRESSPTLGSSPMKTKKKRVFRKQGHSDTRNPHDAADSVVPSSTTGSTATSKAGVKRKHPPLAAAGSAPASRDEDIGDSSARSTPAPTPRPRAVPTRPRMYPCSFEGCTKSFMDKFHLKRHETRHVTQMMTCGIDGCKKAYDSISTMRRHQSMMHKEWKQGMAVSASTSKTSAANGAKRLKLEHRLSNEEGEEDEEEEDGDGQSGTSPTSDMVD
ncbi:hypothetical protein B0O80DRAFT_501148 [Mortierella sp. GBAus27b]|nr:hypothetical protein B0O80DRAFT_501148 [Mortierella sp. GBAus27b]